MCKGSVEMWVQVASTNRSRISLAYPAPMLTILTLDQCQRHYTPSTQVVGKGEKWGDGCSKEQGDCGRDTQKSECPFQLILMLFFPKDTW